MHPLSRWSPIIVLGILSCTIISDEDITSADEATELSPKTFTISQKTVAGNSTLEIKFLYDSVQNFTDATTNTKITRKVGYSIPAMGNFKLKLRSGSTLATKIHITYTDFKKPYTAYIQENDSIIEIYRFRYSATKQLNRIITIINKVDNQPATVFTRDTLIYAGVQLNQLSRRVGSAKTDYTVEYNSFDNELYVSRLKQGSSNVFEPPQSWSGCEGGASCTVYMKTNLGGLPTASAVLIISAFEVNHAPFSLNLQDFRQSGSGITPRGTDIYYFHPLMILRGQQTGGDHLMAIYMLDWWVPSTSTTNPVNNHEDVTFSFKY